jgi:hypothetical protein
MKRFLLSAVMLGVAGLFIGCGDETTKVESKDKVSTPGGTVEVKKTEEVKKTGDEKTNAPAVKP